MGTWRLSPFSPAVVDVAVQCWSFIFRTSPLYSCLGSPGCARSYLMRNIRLLAASLFLVSLSRSLGPFYMPTVMLLHVFIIIIVTEEVEVVAMPLMPR